MILLGFDGADAQHEAIACRGRKLRFSGLGPTEDIAFPHHLDLEVGVAEAGTPAPQIVSGVVRDRHQRRRLREHRGEVVQKRRRITGQVRVGDRSEIVNQLSDLDSRGSGVGDEANEVRVPPLAPSDQQHIARLEAVLDHTAQALGPQPVPEALELPPHGGDRHSHGPVQPAGETFTPPGRTMVRLHIVHSALAMESIEIDPRHRLLARDPRNEDRLLRRSGVGSEAASDLIHHPRDAGEFAGPMHQLGDVHDDSGHPRTLAEGSSTVGHADRR